MSAGTKLFFTTPSQIAGTLWTTVRDRRDLDAARRQRLGLRARARPGDRGRAAARRAARALAHAQCHARSVHHRVQRHAAAGVPAAGDAVVRARAVVEGRDRVHRRAVSDPDQHLRGRAQRRQDADQRGALVRRQRMGHRAAGRGAERDALHRRRAAARDRPRRARRRGGGVLRLGVRARRDDGAGRRPLSGRRRVLRPDRVRGAVAGDDRDGAAAREPAQPLAAAARRRGE